MPYLRPVGVGKVDALVVSHKDKDHFSGLAAVQEFVPVARLLSSIPELAGELRTAGQNWDWDGVFFAMLHPNADDYQRKPKRTNSMSCVLHVETAGGSALLSADIEAENERALLARSSSLKSDVLLVPHHGGAASSTPGFMPLLARRRRSSRRAIATPLTILVPKCWHVTPKAGIGAATAMALCALCWVAPSIWPRYWPGQ